MATSAPEEEERAPRFVELTARMPVVPILLAIGGAALAVSLFATWFEIRQGAFTGVEGPSAAQIRALSETFDQTGWEYFHGADIALFALGLAFAGLGIYDAVRHELPHPLLAVMGLLCAVALIFVIADGFDGDRVTLVDGTLGETAGTVIVDRTRAGGQWVAAIGLVVALAAIVPAWRERRPD
jgi:hypothetical protein